MERVLCGHNRFGLACDAGDEVAGSGEEQRLVLGGTLPAPAGGAEAALQELEEIHSLPDPVIHLIDHSRDATLAYHLEHGTAMFGHGETGDDRRIAVVREGEISRDQV